MFQRLVLVLLFSIFVESTIFCNDAIANILKSSTTHVVVIEDFDDDSNPGVADDLSNITWTLNPSRYITQTDEKQYPQQSIVKAYPRTINSRFYKKNKDVMKAFAIRAAFNRKGHNFIEIIPTQSTQGKPYEVDKNGNRMPGVYFENPILEMGLYIWGSNRDYVFEAEFETSRGKRFTIPFGSLNYQGWKLLKIDIPTKYYRKEDLVKNGSYVLKCNKFVIHTNPRERVDDFVVYLDNLYVSESIARLNYDGRELGEKSFVDGIQWNSSGEQKNITTSPAANTNPATNN